MNGDGVTVKRKVAAFNASHTLSVSILAMPLVALTRNHHVDLHSGGRRISAFGAPVGPDCAGAIDLTQTLKLPQLEPVLNGEASAQATLGQTAEGNLSLTGIDVAAALDSGPSAQICPSGNLRMMDDAAITIDAYAEGQGAATGRSRSKTCA